MKNSKPIKIVGFAGVCKPFGLYLESLRRADYLNRRTHPAQYEKFVLIRDELTRVS